MQDEKVILAWIPAYAGMTKKARITKTEVII